MTDGYGLTVDRHGGATVLWMQLLVSSPPDAQHQQRTTGHEQHASNRNDVAQHIQDQQLVKEIL